MILGGNLLGCLTLLLGTDGYRGAVLVAARDHQHLIPLDTVVADKDISRKVCTSNMPQVQRAIGIGPGYPNKDSLQALYPQLSSFPILPQFLTLRDM